MNNQSRSPGRPKSPKTPNKKKSIKLPVDKTRAPKRAYIYALQKINRHIHRVKGVAGINVTASSAHKSYQNYNGKCAFCGISLNVRRTESLNGLNFIFYVPLEIGGEQSIENLIPVCRDHAKQYSHKREFLEEIPDLNSFADILAVLINSIIESRELEKKKSSDFFLVNEKVKRLKRLLNHQLSEIAIGMKYKAFKDWYPENYEIIREDHNAIADLVEVSANAAIEKDNMSLEKAKDKITNQIKQTVVSKQYKVLRKNENP